MSSAAEAINAMIVSLKKAAGLLQAADIPFALAGGFATWARGAPASQHDVDFVIKEDDRERALATLEQGGFRTEHPPEGWLVKAWDDAVLVDLIYRPNGLEITDDLIAAADLLNVDAMPMKVLRIEDVLVTKLLALNEHSCDYERLLECARSLREQIDWQEVEKRTADSPFARAFFTLVEGLRIVPEG